MRSILSTPERARDREHEKARRDHREIVTTLAAVGALLAFVFDAPEQVGDGAIAKHYGARRRPPSVSP